MQFVATSRKNVLAQQYQMRISSSKRVDVGERMNDSARVSEVTVVDVKMPFGSMVVFMVKWAIAAIPAAVILVTVVVIAASVAAGVFGVAGGFASSVGTSSEAVESIASSSTVPVSRNDPHQIAGTGQVYVDRSGNNTQIHQPRCSKVAKMAQPFGTTWADASQRGFTAHECVITSE